MGWYLRETESHGRVAQTIEVFVEPEDPAVVQAQSFPHGVAALHHRVEGAYSRLLAMKQLTVDVDLQIAISLVERL